AKKACQSTDSLKSGLPRLGKPAHYTQNGPGSKPQLEICSGNRHFCAFSVSLRVSTVSRE
ncbi:hypothetical protein, partial [Serratia sp. PL7]|uniref:hypothetical protein n=1 Tax=Serratia sp. PL7 TaxID=2952201 RepID=UPI0021AD56D9